jgi:hypothetical protein
MAVRALFPPIGFLISQVPLSPGEPLMFAGPPSDFELPPGLVVIRGVWNLREDALLRNAVSRFGVEQWEIVAAAIPGRSAAQCRERWRFRIGPGLNKNPFEKWEDDLIIREREAHGNHWTLISAHLPGRTSCAVKNRWYSVLRKHYRTGVPAEKSEALRFQELLSHPVPALPEVWV